MSIFGRIDLLRCPLHPASGPLKLEGSWLRCPQCTRPFPVVDGIPDLMVSDEDLHEFLASETRQWDEHAARYEVKRQHDLVYQATTSAATSALQAAPGDLVLDAACGTGMTIKEYFQPGMQIVALDLSMESLRQLRASIGNPMLTLVRGNLLALPFAAGTFSKVLCANAIQHLPSESARRQSVGELGRVAQHDGRIVVTVHSFSPSKRRMGWLKEGRAGSSSGAVQYIYRFEMKEFRALLSSAAKVDNVFGAGMPLPYRLKLTPLSRKLERVLWRFPACARWAHMLVGVGYGNREGQV